MLIHWIHSLTVDNLLNSFSIAEMLFSPFHIQLNFINFNPMFLVSHTVEVHTEKEHQADVAPTEPSIASYDLGYEPDEWTLGIG